MKIAVIAANGRAGQAFVNYALSAGHTITAGVRRKSHFWPHSRLTVKKCDVSKEEQVKELLYGQDAVVSFIGHVKGSDPNVQTIGIQNIINVMKEIGMKRIVSLTGTGVRFPNDKITFLDRILNMSIGIIDPKRIKDGKDHVDVLMRSGLDWTIIRVLKLQNIRTKPFELLENGPTKLFVSREEVAQAVLQVIEDKSFIQQAPIISKPKS